MRVFALHSICDSLSLFRTHARAHPSLSVCFSHLHLHLYFAVRSIVCCVALIYICTLSLPTRMFLSSSLMFITDLNVFEMFFFCAVFSLLQFRVGLADVGAAAAVCWFLLSSSFVGWSCLQKR